MILRTGEWPRILASHESLARPIALTQRHPCRHLSPNSFVVVLGTRGLAHFALGVRLRRFDKRCFCKLTWFSIEFASSLLDLRLVGRDNIALLRAHRVRKASLLLVLINSAICDVVLGPTVCINRATEI